MVHSSSLELINPDSFLTIRVYFSLQSPLR